MWLKDYILETVSYSKYFIVFFGNILEIFLYLRRFLPSVIKFIPATPQREPSVLGGRGLLFCSFLSGDHRPGQPRTPV